MLPNIMPTHICFGFKENSIHAKPHIVYVGNDALEMQKAVVEHSKEGYVRMGRLMNPILIPVQIPSLNPTPEVIKNAPAPISEKVKSNKK